MDRLIENSPSLAGKGHRLVLVIAVGLVAGSATLVMVQDNAGVVPLTDLVSVGHLEEQGYRNKDGSKVRDKGES